MNFKIFGFSFGSPEKNSASGVTQYIAPSLSDPSVDLYSGGFMTPMATSLQITSMVKTENDAIAQYRDIARQAEVDLAVEEIVCEMVVMEHQKPAVSLNMDSIDISIELKEVINKEFKTILGLLDFNTDAHTIAKRWYVDGRINYLVSIDENNPQLGIQQLQYVEPQKIKKIREINRDVQNGHPIVRNIKEFFIFNENGIDQSASTSGTTSTTITLTPESVVHCNSGIYDAERGFMVSALETAIRTTNSLRMLEESGIIYMLTRAPERRIFYIDVGNLPKAKIDQYIKEIADKYRTKILYDPVTGKVKNEKRFMSMNEDFFIPRQGGSRGTEIDTLPGGDSFDNTSQLDYFKNQLWDALKVPSSRFQQGSLYTHGSEITRDELRFFNYIQRLRIQFSKLFAELLKRQLVLKGIIALDDWEEFRDNLYFDFTVDNYFKESVENEILQGRLNMIGLADAYVGKYYGPDYVYTNILHVTEEQAAELKKQALQYRSDQIQKQINDQQLMAQLQAESDTELTNILGKQGIDASNYIAIAQQMAQEQQQQ